MAWIPFSVFTLYRAGMCTCLFGVLAQALWKVLGHVCKVTYCLSKTPKPSWAQGFRYRIVTHPPCASHSPVGCSGSPGAHALTFELIKGDTKAQGSSDPLQVAQHTGNRKRGWPLLLSQNHSCCPPAEEIRGLFKPELPQENMYVRGLPPGEALVHGQHQLGEAVSANGMDLEAQSV